jgi:hypothetical protein
MGFEIYKGESSYDSSRNIISDDAAERIARVKSQIGMIAIKSF